MTTSPAPLRRRRVAALSIAAVAILGLGACGGDDDETTTTTTSVPIGATGAEDSEASIPPELEDALRANLLEVQGLTEAQADCAIDYITEHAGDELTSAAESGEVSEDLTDVSFDAGVECADAK